MAAGDGEGEGGGVVEDEDEGRGGVGQDCGLRWWPLGWRFLLLDDGGDGGGPREDVVWDFPSGLVGVRDVDSETVVCF